MKSKKISFKKIGFLFFFSGIIIFLIVETIANILIGIGTICFSIALLRGE